MTGAMPVTKTLTPKQMPPIDLDAYRGGSKDVKRKIERELAACMQKYNFCALKDSSFFADDMMERTYAMVKELFALPQERKNELAAIADPNVESAAALASVLGTGKVTADAVPLGGDTSSPALHVVARVIRNLV